MIYAGYSDWYIAKRLAYSSLKELHRMYGHVFTQMQTEADTKLRVSIGQEYLGKKGQSSKNAFKRLKTSSVATFRAGRWIQRSLGDF
ncbi:hypothetical protein [Lacticaseibacillus paracasei]|uniref:hypothetical protein n=1 Tax=Lacticaseibacillus paracasei TaxID=1597 RepID=UPI0009B66272|nr:hypothetical protein [Lacticaseibacillus paracasei]MCT3350492.1 hypothetical protein [Lacticaseibacillus paracasei]QHC81928.1 hypothetical protein F5J09_09025 [Lacticaseibacillus paracasei]RDG25066.1 hypothetical protein DQM17_05325 [Lacticaseibacillus paracasei]